MMSRIEEIIDFLSDLSADFEIYPMSVLYDINPHTFSIYVADAWGKSDASRINELLNPLKNMCNHLGYELKTYPHNTIELITIKIPSEKFSNANPNLFKSAIGINKFDI